MWFGILFSLLISLPYQFIFAGFDYSFDNIDGGWLFYCWPQDLEFGFLLEVLRKLELGLGVQLAVALVDRDLVGGPEHAL